MRSLVVFLFFSLLSVTVYQTRAETESDVPEAETEEHSGEEEGHELHLSLIHI